MQYGLCELYQLLQETETLCMYLFTCTNPKRFWLKARLTTAAVASKMVDTNRSRWVTYWRNVSALIYI